ncbi:MAG: type VI secretion system tube protein Hcp [Roseivivax sp.]|nr:type VI secretion system tube protein Hcp [Roseivivax sp.]
MAFDAFCFGTGIAGETQDSDYKSKGAFELISFEIGAENNINIGSTTSGGGAGKATFKELSITKKTDKSSPYFFTNLVLGKHIDELQIDLRRSGGTTDSSGGVFMEYKFKLVMIQDMSWSGSDGDDVLEETLVLQFGAIEISYKSQDAKGKMGSPEVSRWSRVLNKASFAV